MKAVRILYIILGIIPFAWLLNFLLILLLGAVKIWRLPKYGDFLDPWATVSHALIFSEAILFFIGFLDIFMFPTATIGLLFEKEFKENYHFLPLILFVTGVAGFFVLKYCFPLQFAWVLD